MEARAFVNLLSRTGKPLCVLEQQDQLLRVHRRRLETKAAIKRLSVGINRVREQRADTGLFGNRQSAADRILQHTETKALSLVVEIGGKPRQNDEWNRVVAHASTNPLRCLQCIDLPHG